MSLTPYLMTVALHAVVLSAASVILVALIRNPRAKAALALGCLMATAVLSWLTPLRPAERPALTIPILLARLPEVAPSALPPALEITELPAVKHEAPSPAPSRGNFRATEFLPVLWAAGTLAGLLAIAGALWRGGRWQRSLEIADEHEWAILHDTLPNELHRDAIPISTETISPCVTGFLKPRIVIPRYLLGGAKPRELAWALRHELTHLDGHDSRWAVAIGLIRSVFWWNPMAHSLALTWSEARERTCDQAAATTGTERADYGVFLVTMAATLSPRPSSGPSMAKHGTAKRLKRRVASLLAAAPGLPPAVSRLQAVGAGLVFAAALGATSLLALEKEEPAAGAGGKSLTLEKILNPPPHIDVSRALLKTSQPFCTQGQIFSAAELNLKLQAVSGGPGFELLTIPRQIEEIGAVSWDHRTTTASNDGGGDSTKPPWDGEVAAEPFIGWVVGWNSGLVRENITLSVKAAYAFAPGYHQLHGLGLIDPSNRSKIRKTALEVEAEVPSGKAVGFTFGEVEPGVHVSMIFGLEVLTKPWETPALHEAGAFPSISPKTTMALGQPVKMTEFKADAPEYLQAQKLSNAAHKVWLDAMNALPENSDLIRQRDIFIEQLKERPEQEKELTWKIHRLGDAILANAETDVEVRIMQTKSTRLSLAASEIFFKMLETRDAELRIREEDRKRWEMNQFERQRHQW